MQALLLAAVTPDNTPHGYNLTFAFPELMFIIIAGALYLRFRAPHRVPGRAAGAAARRQAATQPAASHAEAAAEPAGGPGESAEETLTISRESTEHEGMETEETE